MRRGRRRTSLQRRRRPRRRRRGSRRPLVSLGHLGPSPSFPSSPSSPSWSSSPLEVCSLPPPPHRPPLALTSYPCPFLFLLVLLSSFGILPPPLRCAVLEAGHSGLS